MKALPLTAMRLLLVYIFAQLGPCRRSVCLQMSFAQQHDAGQHDSPSLVPFDKLINYIRAPFVPTNEGPNQARVVLCEVIEQAEQSILEEGTGSAIGRWEEQ